MCGGSTGTWLVGVADRLSRSFVSLAALIVATYAVAESSNSAAAPAATIGLVVAGTVVAIRSLGLAGRVRRRSAVLLVSIGALAVIGSGTGDGVLSALAYLAALAFSLFAVGVILRFVMRATAVDNEIVFAALSVYLLIGILFGTAFTVLTQYDPATFEAGQEIDSSDTSLYYFSFVTLTTVGFGDVVPASGLARMLTVLEALVGQIVLVALVARLVGMQVSHAVVGGHKRGCTLRPLVAHGEPCDLRTEMGVQVDHGQAG